MAEVKERKAETVPVTTAGKGREVQAAPPARAMSPFEEMDRFMDRVMENMLPRRWLGHRLGEAPFWSELGARMPSVDLLDRDDDILLRAEIPGVDKKDLEVSVSDSTVTIRGHSRQEKQEEKGDYFRAEISRGSFSRTISLPHAVDGARAQAVCRDGVLELTMPKIERARRHNVKIQ